MNIVAFLFAIAGAALNMFQPVISTPVSGSVFTGSMYDAVRTIMTSGLPSEGGTVLAILIVAVLCIVPVVAAVTGLFIPFSKSKRIGIILFLCALADGLAAWGIYYISSENFVSPFLTNYVVPYAQKISFITPAIWAAFYVISGVLVLRQREQEIDPTKPIHGPSIIFGLGWTEKKGVNCDLDASAFLLDARGRVLDMIYYDDYHQVHGSGKVWSTGDATKGSTKKEGSSQLDLEQIIVLLEQVPPNIHKIVFVVTNNKTFGHTSSAHARLVERVVVDDEHVVHKNLTIDDPMNGKEPMRKFLNKDKEFADKNGIIVAEIHRKPEGKGWGWSEILEATDGGFDAICRSFGVEVAGASTFNL